jgi:hypothetical protein
MATTWFFDEVLLLTFYCHFSLFFFPPLCLVVCPYLSHTCKHNFGNITFLVLCDTISICLRNERKCILTLGLLMDWEMKRFERLYHHESLYVTLISINGEEEHSSCSLCLLVMALWLIHHLKNPTLENS